MQLPQGSDPTHHLNFSKLDDKYPTSELVFKLDGKEYSFKIMHSKGLPVKEALSKWLDSKAPWFKTERYGYIRFVENNQYEKMNLNCRFFCRFVQKQIWDGFDTFECIEYDFLSYPNLMNSIQRKHELKNGIRRNYFNRKK
ncbi:MAG: hypothetical protein H7329_19605 [Opitutaceae bacterium]|nr:hypothetical protein [Cytophagales bacterium]